MGLESNILFSSDEEKEEKFSFKSHDIIVKLKEIGWTKKSQILSKCFQYKTSGDISFAFDTYNREMLQEMITLISVDGNVIPKHDLNNIFFTRLNASFGSMLEKLIPKAFEEIGTSNFFVKE